MARSLISLGANLGDRAAAIAAALQALASHDRVRLLAQSALVETAPVGGPVGQTPYLNAAALLETDLAPEALLALLLEIEARLSRVRDVRWGPRSLDLDLLLYDDVVIDSPSLTVPHPRMAFRRFALEPAAQIAAEMIHAPTGWTIVRLLENLNAAPAYVALASTDGASASTVAAVVAASGAATWIRDATIDRAEPIDRPTEPAGRALDAEIDLLDERRRRLAAALGGDAGPALSDFWIGQTWAAARLAAAPLAEFEERIAAVQRAVRAPTLLVLLRGDADERLAALEQAIDRWRTGPALRLDARDLAAATREVAAAFAAMA